jgi:hypothetical protein
MLVRILLLTLMSDHSKQCIRRQALLSMQASLRIPGLDQSFNRFSLSALLITETELKVMATLAITGLNRMPEIG